MGGLFSTEPTPTTGGLFYTKPTPTPRPTPTRNYSYVYETQLLPFRQSIPARTPQSTRYESQNNWEDLEQSIHSGGSRQAPSRQVKAPVKSVLDPDRCLIRSDPYFKPSAVVTYIKLQPYDVEYLTVVRKITNKRKVIVDSIEKVENPYLKRAYQLKKEQKQREYLHVEEKLLFHGTPRANVDDICKFNFDWRLCKNHKYGRGVSFSPNATYASNYSDKYVHSKVMIVAKVLIGRSCIGNEDMDLPLSGCDTSQKGADGVVIVKYEDNEYLPVYKINYHQSKPDPIRPKRNLAGRLVPVDDYYADDDFFDMYG